MHLLLEIVNTECDNIWFSPRICSDDRIPIHQMFIG